MTDLPDSTPALTQISAELDRLRQQHDRDRRALESLYRVGMTCTGLSSERAIFDVLRRELQALFALDSCYIALCDQGCPDQFRTAMLYDEGMVEYVEATSFGPLTGRMIREQIPILVGDLAELRGELNRYNTTFGNVSKLSRAWMGVPLQLGSDVLGVISLQSYTPHVFSSDDLDLLQRFGQLVVVALENARLISQQRELSDELATRVAARTEELAVLGAIAMELVLQQPLTVLLDRVLARILPLLDVRAGNMRLFDPARRVLILLAQRGLPEDDARAVAEIPVDSSRIGAVVRENRPVVIERDLAQYALRPTPAYFEALLGVPLRSGDQVIGSMVLLDARPRSFSPQQIELVQLIGNQIAIAIQNARLLEQRDRQIRELTALGTIGHAAATSLDLRMLLGQVYAALSDVMAPEAFVMSIYDPRREVIVEGVGIDEGQTYEYFTRNAPPTPGSFTAWVLRNRRMLHLRDVAAEMGRYPELVSVLSGSGRPAASWLGVPLVGRDEQVIGTIVVQSYTPRAFDDQDERFLQRVAQQAALHVQNVTLLAQRERQIRELHAIGRIGQLVSATYDLEQILQVVYETLQGTTGAPIFYLLICQPHSHIITNAMFIEAGQHSNAGSVGSPPRPGSLTDWILRHREPLLYADLQAHLAERAAPELSPVRFGSPGQARSWAGVPLLAQNGEAIGVLSVQDYQPNLYDQQTLELLRQVASHVSLGVQKIRLFQERDQQLRENARLLTAEHAARQTADTLREVARVLSGTFDLNEVLDLILDQLRTVIAYDSASIMLLEGEALRIAAECGLEHLDELRRLPLSLSSPSGAGLVARGREPVVIDDTRIAPNWHVYPYGLDVRSWLGVPLVAKGRVLGTLNIDSRRPHRFTPRDVEVALAFANQAAVALENARLYQESVTRVEQELEIARRIQINLFPQHLPAIPGLQIAARVIPARETGGDFYDIVLLDELRFGLLVGDASGKSIPGAMLMAIAHSIARSEARDHELPATVMSETNRWIAQDVPPRAFVALSYARLDAGAGRMALANAGQLAPLCRRADGRVEYLEVPGPTMPLGIHRETAYDALEVSLALGDTVVFYTDGIVEAHNPCRELFGFERLEDLLRTAGHVPPAEWIALVLAAVDQFSAGTPQHDDMTLVVLRVT